MQLVELIIRSLLFYTVPVVIGWSVWQVIKLASKPAPSLTSRQNDGGQKLSATKLVTSLSISAGLGVTLLLLLAIIIQAMSAGNTQFFTFWFFPLVYLIFFSGALAAGFRFIKSFPLPSKQVMQTSLAILVVTLLAYLIWCWRSPYQLNWDMYEHQVLSTAIQQGQFSFKTSQISDTFGFNSYPPTFHLLVAISQFGMSSTPTDILNYWQVINYFHLLSIGFGSYLVGWAITKHRSIAFLSLLVGSLVFESVVAFTSFFLLPQTLTAAMFSIFWSVIVINQAFPNKRSGCLILSLLCLPLLLMHYVIGSLAVITLIGSYLLIRFQLLGNTKHASYLFAAVIALAAIGFGLADLIDLSTINQGEAASYTFSIQEKFNYLTRIYGLSIILFGLLGLVVIIKNRSKSSYQLLALILIAFIALLIANLPYVLKFYTLGRFFIHVAMALGAWQIIKLLGKFKPIGTFFFGFMLAIILILNSQHWKTHLWNGGNFTHISSNDIAAASFLQTELAGTNVLLISDPSTMYLMEGLSGINSPGGAFTSEKTRQGLINFFSNTKQLDVNVLEVIEDKLTTNPSQRLLIVSARTMRWLEANEEQQLSFEFNIWRPEQFTFQDELVITQLKNNNLPLIYQNSSYSIFLL